MKSPSKELLNKWTLMTDANEHGLVREDIADWLQTTPEWRREPCCSVRDYKMCFSYINKLHFESSALPYELSIIRNIITRMMMDEIRKFSRTVYEKIETCL